MKKINKALDSKEEKNVEQIKTDQRKFEKTIDTAARKGIVHKKTAARKKSRMAKKINALQKQQA
jgi:small subunit ribosomal protein S20